MKKSPPYHVFICTGTKADGKEGICHSRGSAETIDCLRKLVAQHHLADAVLVNGCDCFRSRISTCGPNLVVYPEGVWYGGVSLPDLEEIVESHFKRGEIVERLLLQ